MKISNLKIRAFVFPPFVRLYVQHFKSLRAVDLVVPVHALHTNFSFHYIRLDYLL